jgi:hypothetical protein
LVDQISPRGFVRYQPVHWGPAVTLQFNGTQVQASVLDESLSGIGVIVADAGIMHEGQIVEVSNDRFARLARVVFVADATEKGQRIGLTFMPHSDFREI